MPTHFQIFRNRKLALPNFFISLLIAQSNLAFAAGGVGHGTYYATYSADDYIAVATLANR